MSSLIVLRYGARAQLLSKRFLFVVGQANIKNCRNYSADAAAAAITKPTNRTAERKDVIIQTKLKAVIDKEIANGSVVPAFKRALIYGNKIAVKDENGEYSYNQIYLGAKKLAAQISDVCGIQTNSKVAILCPNTALYTIVQWGCWISGQIVVPLSSQHPPNLMEYFLKDSQARVVVTTSYYEERLKPLAESLGVSLIIADQNLIPAAESLTIDNSEDKTLSDLQKGVPDSQFYTKSNALILYTSGSTGHPKGAIISHSNLQAQISCLADAWKVDHKDCILHVLPLNHVHGSVNALLLPLTVGAKVSMQTNFDPASVWSTLLNINLPSKDRISLFMAVPTIYSLLITEYDKVFSKNERMVEYIRAQCEKKTRLMICGSAPLPVSVFDRWKQITGHKLLERYGMTEIGMVLSNPYIMDKFRDRVPGTVGAPLPGAEVKLVKDNQAVCQVKGEYGKGIWAAEGAPFFEKTTTSTDDSKENEKIGELYVKGPTVFIGYHNKAEETANAFIDGWFKTGDVANYKNGAFKILGRTSVDIIKSGAYKISAIEVETHLLEHPVISDICIVGIPDVTWGQRVAALIVCKPNETLTMKQLTEWCEERIAPYQIPTAVKVVDEIPRNAMGKVNKKDIVQTFFSNKAEKN